MKSRIEQALAGMPKPIAEFLTPITAYSGRI